MSQPAICPVQYQLINDHCFHYLWPPSLGIVIGSTILGFSNSLATLAGVGGGSIAMVLLMSFFKYLPKDASLVVFACVLGTAAGNTMNLIHKAYNGKPLIQYKFAFVSIPIMFTGSFIGVLLNKLLPSIATYSLLVILFFISLKKSYYRFINQYRKQSEQILLHGQKITDLHQQTPAEPFKDQRTVYILKNIAAIVTIIMILSFVRGSSKFPSIIGLKPCSVTYWIFYVLSFLIAILYSYRNIQILKTWYSSKQHESNNEQKDNHFQTHIAQVIQKSVGAGIISGFGLGGGIFLVPMYRNLGCKPLEATATCSFGIFVTSFINCLQAVSIGAIQFSQIGYFVLFLGVVANIMSRIISNQLRKRNRFSLVEGIFLILTILAIVNIPISLYRRYADNGYDGRVIFGFGHLC